MDNKYLPWILFAVVLVLFGWQCNRDVEPEVITKTVTLVTPEISGAVAVPQAELSAPVKVIERTIHITAVDSVPTVVGDSVKLFDRIYQQEFEDEHMFTLVSSTVRGELLDQQINYTIKPQRIDTTLTIPIEPKANVFSSIAIGVPAVPEAKFNMLIGGAYQFKNRNIITLDVDLNGTVYAGYKFKL